MNDLQSDEELAFVVEDAKEHIIVPAVEKVLKGVDFNQVMVEQWTDTICESCMQGLVDLQKPFKYIGEFGRRRLFCRLVSFDGARETVTHHGRVGGWGGGERERENVCATGQHWGADTC